MVCSHTHTLGPVVRPRPVLRRVRSYKIWNIYPSPSPTSITDYCRPAQRTPQRSRSEFFFRFFLHRKQYGSQTRTPEQRTVFLQLGLADHGPVCVKPEENSLARKLILMTAGKLLDQLRTSLGWHSSETPVGHMNAVQLA